jgi:hypothetical protein
MIISINGLINMANELFQKTILNGWQFEKNQLIPINFFKSKHIIKWLETKIVKLYVSKFNLRKKDVFQIADSYPLSTITSIQKKEEKVASHYLADIDLLSK